MYCINPADFKKLHPLLQECANTSERVDFEEQNSDDGNSDEESDEEDQDEYDEGIPITITNHDWKHVSKTGLVELNLFNAELVDESFDEFLMHFGRSNSMYEQEFVHDHETLESLLKDYSLDYEDFFNNYYEESIKYEKDGHTFESYRTFICLHKVVRKTAQLGPDRWPEESVEEDAEADTSPDTSPDKPARCYAKVYIGAPALNASIRKCPLKKKGKQTKQTQPSRNSKVGFSLGEDLIDTDSEQGRSLPSIPPQIDRKDDDAKTPMPEAGDKRKRAPSGESLHMPELEVQVTLLVSYLVRHIILASESSKVLSFSGSPQNLELHLPTKIKAKGIVSVPNDGAVLMKEGLSILKGPMIGFEFKRPKLRALNHYIKALAQCSCQMIAIVQQRWRFFGLIPHHQHINTVYQVYIRGRRAQFMHVMFPPTYIDALTKLKSLPRLRIQLSPVFDLTTKEGVTQFISLLFLAVEQLKHEMDKEGRNI